MKIAVCDDSREDRKKITEYLLRYSEGNMLDIEVEEFSSGEELLSAGPFKAAFLDIYMEGLSGVETAYKLRENSGECAVVFTTTSPDFRTDGFEVGAVHYLIKPITYDNVVAAMERCKRLFGEDAKYFSVMSDRHAVRVQMKNVLFAEVYGKEVLIHTMTETVRTRAALSEIAELLNAGPFLACHRCYIVNMQHIEDVLEEDFLLKTGERVPIRKNGRQKVKDEYSGYLFRCVRGWA